MSDHPTSRHPGCGRPWLAAGLLGALGVTAASTTASSQVAVPIADLPPGASITVEVLVTVNGTVPAGVAQIVNQGTVSAPTSPSPSPTTRRYRRTR